MMKNTIVTLAAAVTLTVCGTTLSRAASPPFTQCSPSGYNCNMLITVDRYGNATIASDTNMNWYPPNYAQSASLIGVQNNSRGTVYTISLNALVGDDQYTIRCCGMPSLPPFNASNVSVINIPHGNFGVSNPPYYTVNSPFPPSWWQPSYGPVWFFWAGDVVFSGGIPKGGSSYFSVSNISPNYPYFSVSASTIVPSISFPDGVDQGQTATATVTVYPTQQTAVAVSLALTTVSGTGSAVFTATNSTTQTINITQSGTVQIKGVTGSSVSGNIKLSATVNGVERDVYFTVVPPPQITGITPGSAMIGSNNVSITIDGNNFGNSPQVNLPPGFTNTGQGSTPSSIVVTANIDFSAAIGPANISVTANTQTSNSVSFTVDGPNRMVVQSDTTTTVNGVYSRLVTYQVLNVSGTPAAAIPIAEAINESNWSCDQPNPGPGSYAHCDATYHTDSNGYFTDQWSLNYAGYTPTGCGTDITDQWQWCGPVGSSPPAPNPGKTFGTLTGFVHTNSSKINGYVNPPQAMPSGFVINP